MKTLIIIGHSHKDSLSHSIAKAYAKGSTKKGETKVLDLATLKFDHILRSGFSGKQEFEEDLQKSQELIKWADHMVYIFPIWWSSYPAIFKGFIDRVFLPGFSFEYRENNPIPLGLLKGKTAEIISTSDAPTFFRRFILGDPAIKSFKRDTLKFCGVKVKKVTRFGSVISQGEVKIKEFLKRVEALA